MIQFASYLRRVLCKTRLIYPRINGPNIVMGSLATVNELKIIIFVLNYLTVLVYTKTIIRFIVGG